MTRISSGGLQTESTRLMRLVAFQTHWRRQALTRTGGVRSFALGTDDRPRAPQTVVEKIVQKYAVGLPDGKSVQTGDYVMIRPEHVMTHDNTGPVISKYVSLPRKHKFSHVTH